MPPFGGLPWPKSCARFGSISFAARLQVVLVQQRLRAHVHVVDVGDVAPARRRRRASSPRSAGARCRRRRPGASAGRSARGCRARSARRCPGRWAGSRAACSRDSPSRAASPSRPVRRQVGRAHRAALLLRMRLELLGELAAIERLALGRGDLFQRRACFLEAESFSRARERAVRQERLGETGLVSSARRPAPATARRWSARPGSPRGRSGSPARTACANGSLPNLPCSSTQAETQPGTVTASQPRTGMAVLAAEVVGRPRRGRAPRGVQAVQLAARPRRCA